MAGMRKEADVQIAKNMVALGMAACLNYIITFFLTQYITENIGIDSYGFVSIAKTFVQYAQIFTIAMTTFIVRYIFVSYESGNRKEAESFYSSSLAGCLAIAGGIFLFMIPVIIHLEIFLSIPDELQKPVKLLFILIFFNFVLQTVGIPLGSSVYIKNRLDITGKIQILSYAIDAGVLVILFHLVNPSVWVVGMGAVASGTVTLVSYLLVAKKHTPDLRFRRKAVDCHKVLLLLKNGIWDSLNSLGNVLNSGLDLLISNLMLDGVITGQISVAKTVGSMFSGLYQMIFQAFQPAMLKAYSSGNKDIFMQELRKAMKICGCFSNILLAGFFALGKLYYQLWMPGQDSQALYFFTVLTIATGLTGGAMRPVYYVYTLTLKNKIPCIVTILGGSLNILWMYVLLKYTEMGGAAVVATTAVIMIGINLFFNPVYAAKVLKVQKWLFYEVILKHLLSAALMTIFFTLITKIMNPSGWLGLLLSASVMVIAGIVIHSMVQGILVTEITRWKKHRRG